MIDEYNSTKAKSLDTYFGYAPNKIIRGKGIKLYDEKDNEFIDYGMALGSVFLGYAYDEVDKFVITQIRKGVNFSRPSFLEEKLSKILQKDIGLDKIIRFAKSSSILLNIIPRVCRYLSGKELIAYPKDCFLGNCDWYFAQTFNSGGILSDIKNKTINFEKGNCDSLLNLFSKYGERLSCIIMEPYREEVYNPEFYQILTQKCIENSVFLVFDETITGFRYDYPLAQKKVNCEPDFTIIGKAISNGYALSAVIASKNIFNKIDKAYKDNKLFDFSITHAGEIVGISAAIKTIGIIKEKQVINYVNNLGKYFILRLNEIIKKYNLNTKFIIRGHPTYFQLTSPKGYLDNTKKIDILRFYYENNILFRGFFSICYQHNKPDVDKFLDLFDHYCLAYQKKFILVQKLN
ncbi:MAG: aminotransferase class III-fold pyridoxal phosphate-dependent enzyme [Bacteroidetes bacterium]|nr:aminotransferase class III-fold pyridoxal phosphate-dependent enzyme [Bacteroidota bacterium]